MNSERLIKIQGIGFCALALTLTAFVSMTKLLTGPVEIIALSFFIGILGVPHGALDTLFAKNIFQLDNFKKWSLFIVVYLSIAALVLQLWLQFPVFFLISFLAVSIFHFSGDPVKRVPWFRRLLYGGSIIFLPTLYHSSEVLRLFSFLVKSNDVQPLVQTMHLIAGPWALTVLVVCLSEFKADWLGSLEMISVSILAIFVLPLTAFTIFFCGMHSARHTLRMSELTKSSSQSLRLFFMAATVPTLAVALVATVVWIFPSESSFDAQLVQIVFLGLAALTVPHMVLLDGSTFFLNRLQKLKVSKTENEMT